MTIKAAKEAFADNAELQRYEAAASAIGGFFGVNSECIRGITTISQEKRKKPVSTYGVIVSLDGLSSPAVKTVDGYKSANQVMELLGIDDETEIFLLVYQGKFGPRISNTIICLEPGLTGRMGYKLYNIYPTERSYNSADTLLPASSSAVNPVDGVGMVGVSTVPFVLEKGINAAEIMDGLHDDYHVVMEHLSEKKKLRKSEASRMVAFAKQLLG